MNANGLAIRSPFGEDVSQQYCEMFSELCIAARNSVRTLDPENDLTFMRVRSHKHEIMVAPAKDYVLLVVQNPNVDEAGRSRLLQLSYGDDPLQVGDQEGKKGNQKISIMNSWDED